MLFIDRRLRVAATSSKKNLCGCLRAFIVVPLKVYLHNKMITSLNVSYKAQVKFFFISQKSYVPFLRYSSFVFLMIP